MKAKIKELTYSYYGGSLRWEIILESGKMLNLYCTPGWMHVEDNKLITSGIYSDKEFEEYMVRFQHELNMYS